jgi:membrane protease YdiL (CAAX protease family)
MLRQTAYSSLLAIGCLVAVYAPTFALVSLLIVSGMLGHLSKSGARLVAIPLVIIISTVIALAIMALLARRRGLTLAAYGFKTTPSRHLAVALALGLLSAFGLRALSWILPIHDSLDMGNLQKWQIILFFWISAPIQEEIVFRGFLQSVVEIHRPGVVRLGRLTLPFAVCISALLFAVVHIATGRLGASLGQVMFIVFGAFVLGLLAGWLRWKSSSLLPAILVHAIFNILAG